MGIASVFDDDEKPDLSDFLPFCGCGQPEPVARLYCEALEWFEKKEKLLESAPGPREWSAWCNANRETFDGLLNGPCQGNQRLYWLVLYVFDKEDLTDHGGGVGASWLTAKGKDALVAAKAWLAWDARRRPS